MPTNALATQRKATRVVEYDLLFRELLKLSSLVGEMKAKVDLQADNIKTILHNEEKFRKQLEANNAQVAALRGEIQGRKSVEDRNQTRVDIHGERSNTQIGNHNQQGNGN